MKIMVDPAIKRKRLESALYERLCEAIATLGDLELSELTLLGAELSKDRRDATAIVDASGVAETSRPRLLGKLKKASGYLSRYVVAAEGWHRSPTLHFRFDSSLEGAARLDELFARLHKDKL
ncbi:hypothetical protein FACS189487_01580 [Campylobacterota bacterium]|nr:hypothetical protein FACS189487_01580 [Campylobacterota bacterium]